jgi:two-component system response regulator LytT
MNILIIEDESLVAKKLYKLVMELEPAARIQEVTTSIAGTVTWLQNNPHPDLILMDIELADGQSFDIFKQVEIKSPVIFTTAYDEFAIKAFKVNSIDYLLKPVKSDELQMALNKFHALASNTSKNASTDYDKLLTALKKLAVAKSFKDRFLVKQGQKSFSITTTEIAFFFTDKSVNYLFTRDKRKFIIDYTLDEIERSLDPVYFFRANRQSILASAAVVAVHSWFNGKLKIEIKPDHEDHVVVSREKAGEFREWLGE